MNFGKPIQNTGGFLSDFQTLSTIPNPFHQLILLKSKPYGLQSLRPSKSVFSFFQQMYSANLVKLYYIVRNCLEQEQSIVSQVSIITQKMFCVSKREYCQGIYV